MVTDSRAYPERNGPPDPKTPEKGSALLSSTTSFLWRPHQQSLVHWAYKSPQLSGLPEPHVLSDVITRWSFVPQDNSLSARMFPSTSTRVTGLAEENTLLKILSVFQTRILGDMRFCQRSDYGVPYGYLLGRLWIYKEVSHLKKSLINQCLSCFYRWIKSTWETSSPGDLSIRDPGITQKHAMRFQECYSAGTTAVALVCRLVALILLLHRGVCIFPVARKFSGQWYPYL